MKKRKLPKKRRRTPKKPKVRPWGPGWTFFDCTECLITWREASRHCESCSLSFCPNCEETPAYPAAHERHDEWKVDQHGNLVNFRLRIEMLVADPTGSLFNGGKQAPDRWVSLLVERDVPYPGADASVRLHE